MQKIGLIAVLFCASTSFAQTPFDIFDTTMKKVPLFKSDKPQIFRLDVAETNTATRYLILDVDNAELLFYTNKDSLLSISKLKPTEVKFLSVDPLANKYPQLAPYQFASNTPIQAIDLDGLEAFIIHGTKQTKTGIDFSSQTMAQLSRISGHSTNAFDNTFRWNAPQLNKQHTRKLESAKLVEHVTKARHEMIMKGAITENESITLIGYSHGGNVSLQAIKTLNDKYGVQVNLITLSTPAYNRGRADGGRWDFEPENPKGNAGINSHIQIVHENDNVVDLAGGTETYKNPRTINYLITEKDIPLSGGIESHTEVYKSPLYSKFLERVKPLSKAPVPVSLNPSKKN